MNDEAYGALKRIVEEVEEKREAKCLNIDCVVNHRIGGNDIDIVKGWINEKNKPCPECQDNDRNCQHCQWI